MTELIRTNLVQDNLCLWPGQISCVCWRLQRLQQHPTLLFGLLAESVGVYTDFGNAQAGDKVFPCLFWFVFPST